MSWHKLIFSNERRYRISRHLGFWLCWYLFMATTTLRLETPEVLGVRNFIIYQLQVSSHRLVLQIVFCYATVYFIIPRYLKKGHTLQFTVFSLIFLFGFYWLTYLYYWLAWVTPSPINWGVFQYLSSFRHKYYIFYSHLNFSGTIVSCGIVLLIKYYKSWYTKQRETESLVQENARAELQLLKAQVHPHFLFNTLNNIYALSLDESPKTGIILKKLSGMIRYMINEGSAPFVPVSSEITMLLDYIGLEKIRYDDRLEMTVDIKYAHSDSRLIAPLLMIAFVENSFKHGASKIMDKAWIHLSIETGEDSLEFKISNTRPASLGKTEERKKIGLINVQKRLQLLYPGKHILDIQSSKDVFTVKMKIDFEKQKSIITEQQLIPASHKMINYAQ